MNRPKYPCPVCKRLCTVTSENRVAKHRDGQNGPCAGGGQALAAVVRAVLRPWEKWRRGRRRLLAREQERRNELTWAQRRVVYAREECARATARHAKTAAALAAWDAAHPEPQRDR